MKKILAMAIATVAVVACTTTKQAEPEKTQAQQLMERLREERLWRLSCRYGFRTWRHRNG